MNRFLLFLILVGAITVHRKINSFLHKKDILAGRFAAHCSEMKKKFKLKLTEWRIYKLLATII
jgi:hypothetical protein